MTREQAYEICPAWDTYSVRNGSGHGHQHTPMVYTLP